MCIRDRPEVFQHCKVSNIYASDAFFADAIANSCGAAGLLNDYLKKKGFQIKKLGKLNVSKTKSHDSSYNQCLEIKTLNNTTKIKILWPIEQICKNKNLGDNDKSVVSLIEFAGRKILLCSDIEKVAQRELLRLFPNLKADVVVVPHHGSAKTTEPGFLGSLDADISICSCSQAAYEKGQTINIKNSPILLCLSDDTQEASYINLLYTAKSGAITVHIYKNGKIKAPFCRVTDY